ncbi:MAG TPA: hypothetical protein VFG42_02855 [Baekduia sp.]|uniref:hypothetical protein n=1 Tax=Baekduia sp. TaxID=2600305 RepID=UPI002D78D3FD|nr:hypothetical protein [Baekduia sp.]HET6505708.1 hypothetical protein [Baekduia sp.]
MAVLAIAVTGGAVAAFASSDQGTSPDTLASPPARVAGNYSVLRAAKSASDAVPADVAKGFAPSTLDNAHQLRTQLSRGRSWLASTVDGGICLIIELGAAGCQNADNAGRGIVEALGGAGGGPDFKDGEVLIYGVVPDGVTNATLYLKSGESQSLKVVGNAISADVMGPTERVEYTDAAGALVTIPAPSYTG